MAIFANSYYSALTGMSEKLLVWYIQKEVNICHIPWGECCEVIQKVVL